MRILLLLLLLLLFINTLVSMRQMKKEKTGNSVEAADTDESSEVHYENVGGVASGSLYHEIDPSQMFRTYGIPTYGILTYGIPHIWYSHIWYSNKYISRINNMYQLV